MKTYLQSTGATELAICGVVVHSKRKKGLAEFHSQHFYSATITAKAFQAL